jgi:glycosyltransferase involved in cell wall biosynthesis
VKIVLLHNRYHVTSGPERYLFSLETLLRERGHVVVPFSVRYARNRPSPHDRYFVPPPGGEDARYYRELRGPLARTRLFFRSVYHAPSRRLLRRLLREERPDLAYVLIVANVLSPSVLSACRDAGLPIVMRLSDFHLIAPCYNFFDGTSGCELCLHGSRWQAVRKRCLQGSSLVSLGRIAGMAVHDRLGIYDAVDRFVAPSTFLRDKMVAGGVAPERIVHIPSFTELDRPGGECPVGNSLLFVGRLTPEKGVARLLEAWGLAGCPGELRIVGELDSPTGENLRAESARRGLAGVSFLGARSSGEVRQLMDEARAVVIPSLCYENSPLVALEAMASGRAVLAHRMGSLPEVVMDGVSGFLSSPDDPRDLAARIGQLMRDPALAAELGRAGRRRAEEKYGPQQHLDRLLALWGGLLEGRRPGRDR